MEVVVDVPKYASFWVPKPLDIDEEGFGFFRNVRPIVAVGTFETATLLESETLAADYVGTRATTELEFDTLAAALESFDGQWDDDDIPDVSDIDSRFQGLEGLELGVAGLVFALSNAGFYPAASCRSHPNDASWSPNPIVYFAGDEPRMRLLELLASSAGCGVELASDRDNLFVVYAPSVCETMALARTLFTDRVRFRKLPKTNRRQGVRRSVARQEGRLF
ncbi:MAG: hypothetical protein JW722_05270 [Demequinaceae bacterium]|nr:hypothetical protein [Demequinaceae bacterium]